MLNSVMSWPTRNKLLESVVWSTSFSSESSWRCKNVNSRKVFDKCHPINHNTGPGYWILDNAGLQYFLTEFMKLNGLREQCICRRYEICVMWNVDHITYMVVQKSFHHCTALSSAADSAILIFFGIRLHHNVKNMSKAARPMLIFYK